MASPFANLRAVFTGEGKLRKAFTFPLPRRDCIQAIRLQVTTLYSTRIRNAVMFTANYKQSCNFANRTFNKPLFFYLDMFELT